MKLLPGTLIVVEGLDATGKSTVCSALQQAQWLQKPKFTHQPSGAIGLGQEIYRMTEDRVFANPWTRQLLHLASHAEHYASLGKDLVERGVIMDRCWWSSVAYGYYQDGLGERSEMTLEEYVRLCLIPAQGRLPDLVFLFMHPWKEDPHNSAEVEGAYWDLAEMYPENTVIMDQNPTDVQVNVILSVLANRGLLVGN